MSHSSGEVWRAGDPVVYFFEYNGTSDVVRPAIWETQGQLEEHWRDDDGGWNRSRDCGHAGEPVIVYSHYGGGFWWRGTACFECMVILPPYTMDEFFDHMTDGAPTDDVRLSLAARHRHQERGRV